MEPGPIFTMDTSSTITCLLAANHYLPHHTFNPLLQQPVRLTTSLLVGAKSWVCVVQVSALLATPVWRFLPPTGSITSVSYWGNTCCCAASHLALGVPNRLHINWAINKFSGAVAGEAKDVFTRGVLHFLSLYFVFSLLCFFCFVLFASFQKTQKNSLVWFYCLIQKHKLVLTLVGGLSLPCLVMLSINGWFLWN